MQPVFTCRVCGGMVVAASAPLSEKHLHPNHQYTYMCRAESCTSNRIVETVRSYALEQDHTYVELHILARLYCAPIEQAAHEHHSLKCIAEARHLTGNNKSPVNLHRKVDLKVFGGSVFSTHSSIKMHPRLHTSQP